MFRLLPKEEKFFEMFFDAAENIQAAAKLLKEMLESGENLDRFTREIKELEHSGDKMTHEIINKLNKTFVTPFDREDIYDLCRALDDVLDNIDSAAHRIIIYQIADPGQNAIRLAQLIIECSDEIIQAISNLHQIDKVYPHCVEINRLENEGDAILRETLAWLFQNKKDAIDIIKLKDLYEDLELAIDRCEDVANVLEAIAVKNQ
jgi:predicted phosphate transport protein (TIGR00153 family)